MKKVVLASAVALTAIAGGASAMTDSGSFANGVAVSKIQKVVPGADLTGYSDAAIIHLLQTINTGDDLSTAQLKSKVQSQLNHLQ
jgi:hypothetical protein